MEKGIYVKDIIPDMEVKGIFVISQPSMSKTRNDDPFWKLYLNDCTGSIEARIWAPLSTRIKTLEAGLIAKINGISNLYNKSLQVIISAFSPLSQEEEAEIDFGYLTQVCPHDREEMFANLLELCMEEFSYEPWRKLINEVLNNPEIQKGFKRSCAAKNMHHAYVGGLLEHSLSVFKLCRSLCELYPQLDRQTLLAGALFHDLGKIQELSTGLVNDYTDIGSLAGHISLGLEILQPFLERSELEPDLVNHLKHLILSHHGQYEFGAPCLPQTPEAFVLHHADNMDAKINQLYKLYDEQKIEASQWSSWQNNMNRRIYNPIRTPQQEVEE